MIVAIFLPVLIGVLSVVALVVGANIYLDYALLHKRESIDRMLNRNALTNNHYRLQVVHSNESTRGWTILNDTSVIDGISAIRMYYHLRLVKKHGAGAVIELSDVCADRNLAARIAERRLKEF